jgi:nitrite reductase/ring-hydroxylating ferredoxin subunit
MQRREFLEKLGIGAAFAITTSCFQSCTKDPEVTAVDFTVDLSVETKLLTKGNYIIKNGVVVALGNDGVYYACTVICTHEDLKKMTYNKATNEFFCTEHKARFDLKGTGLNKEGEKGIAVYQTALTGTSLRVFS